MNKEIISAFIFAFCAVVYNIVKADTGAGGENKTGISAEDMKTLTDGIGGKNFESARLAYENLGYVSGLVELAKSDEKAKEYLGKLEENLAKLALENDNYAVMRLAEIAYLKGDAELFKKYARKGLAESAAYAAGIFGKNPSLDGLKKFKKYNSTVVYRDMLKAYMRSGKDKEAGDLLDSDLYCELKDGSPNTLLYDFGKMGKKTRRKLVSLLKNLKNKNVSTYAAIYAISLRDKTFEADGKNALNELEKYPEAMRLRELSRMCNFLDLKNERLKIFERLYALEALSAYDELDLAKKWLGVPSLYGELSFKDFSSNPKREEILKIFEEKYASQPDDFYLISNLAGMYRALGMEQKRTEFLEKAIKIISNPGTVKTLAVSFALGSVNIDKNTQKFEKIIAGLGNSEKADAYIEIVHGLLNGNYFKMVPEKLKEAVSYNKKAMELGNFSNCYTVYSKLGEDEWNSLFLEYPENKYIKFLEGMHLAENGDWEKARKVFERSSDMGCVYAKGILMACAFQGINEKKDRAKAEKLRSEIESAFESECMDKTQVGIKISNNIEHLFALDNETQKYVYSIGRDSEDRGDNYQNSIYHKINSIKYRADREKYVDDLYQKCAIEKTGMENLTFLINHYAYNKDYEKLLNCSKLAHERENPLAVYYPAMLMFGIPNEKDEKLAFEKLNERPYNDFYKYLISYAYRYGIGTAKNIKKADEIISTISVWQDFDMSLLREVVDLSGHTEYVINYQLENKDLKVNERLYKIRSLIGLYEEYDVSKLPKSLKLYEDFAKENPAAYKELAALYKNTSICDPKKTFEYNQKYAQCYKKLYSIDDINSNLDMAFAYLHGIGVEKGEKEAFDIFKKCSEKPYRDGSMKALECMAFCLENGIGTAKDTAKADKIRENIKRMVSYNIKPMYFDAVLLLKDLYQKNALGNYPNKRKYWTEFFAKNSPEDRNSKLCKLYDLYTFDRENADPKKAFEIIMEIEKSGSKLSGEMEQRKALSLYYGIGTEKDEQKGMAILEELLKRGDFDAAESLDYIHKKSGDKTEIPEISELFRVASPEILIITAKKYVSGLAGAKDLEHAKYLLKLAADKRSKKAKEHFDNFEKFVRQNS